MGFVKLLYFHLNFLKQANCLSILPLAFLLYSSSAKQSRKLITSISIPFVALSRKNVFTLWSLYTWLRIENKNYLRFSWNERRSTESNEMVLSSIYNSFPKSWNKKRRRFAVSFSMNAAQWTPTQDRSSCLLWYIFDVWKSLK